MKYRTGSILIIGFGSLLILIGFLGFTASRKAEQIYENVSAIHETYRNSAYHLDTILTETNRSGILIRDYLLDPLPTAGARYRQDLLDIRASITTHVDALSPLITRDERKALKRLRYELDVYWASRFPIFEWTPLQKAALGSSFLRREVVPRRNAVLSMTREIDRLNAASFAKEQERINTSRSDFSAYLGKMLAIILSLSVIVAATSILRISRLEQRSERQREKTELAEQELRRLSQQLVQAQEEERKSISRELHDQIGQVLTALRMELGNLERLRATPGDEFRQHLVETKGLAEKTMQSVRDLAMGLRPSILDDLGVGPALQWQAREFSRRSGIPVAAEIDGDLENLPEELRTCVYRVVQESLTNCARHAQAKNIRVTLHGGKSSISMTVQDDGVGFDPKGTSGRGLGLIGMEERVKKLGGSMSILSSFQKGTILEVELPLSGETTS